MNLIFSSSDWRPLKKKKRLQELEQGPGEEGAAALKALGPANAAQFLAWELACQAAGVRRVERG